MHVLVFYPLLNWKMHGETMKFVYNVMWYICRDLRVCWVGTGTTCVAKQNCFIFLSHGFVTQFWVMDLWLSFVSWSQMSANQCCTVLTILCVYWRCSVKYCVLEMQCKYCVLEMQCKYCVLEMQCKYCEVGYWIFKFLLQGVNKNRVAV